MRQRKYTDEQFIDAVQNSLSIRAVLEKLNLKPAGGNYKVFHLTVKELNIDTSHFSGQLHSKGKVLASKRPIEDYLCNKQTIQSFKLKRRLLKEKIFLPNCSSCKLDSWLSKPIPLELDHIDGNHLNNNLVNLRLLCPNCHAQTSTYRGKNKKKS
jgi:hypothetical protein